MKYEPIVIFATPASKEALLKYKALFSAPDEVEAAQLGYDNFRNEELGDILEKLKPVNRIVAWTVAGMRWNLLCKELKEAKDVA